MIADVIIDGETVLTINMKSVNFLLERQDKIDFPVKMDDRTVTIQFRKTKDSLPLPSTTPNTG